MRLIERLLTVIVLVCVISVLESESASEAYRRDPGHPQWHHGAFHDVKDSVRSDLRRMLHSRAEVSLLCVCVCPCRLKVFLSEFVADFSLNCYLLYIF